MVHVFPQESETLAWRSKLRFASRPGVSEPLNPHDVDRGFSVLG